MNRVIKFKAWDEVRKEWIPNNLLFMDYDGQVLAGDIYNPPYTLISPKNVAIYTGLNDKNGKEIFGGNIVKGTSYSGFERNNEVTFLNGCWMFGNWNAHEFFNRHQNIEVIGNIYQHPHLLEGSEPNEQT